MLKNSRFEKQELADSVESTIDEEEFVELITSCQGKLFAYTLAALGDADLATDVLQEVNLVAWRKSSEFKSGTNFDAWVYRIASFQVMAHRQRMIRDKLMFDQPLVEQIARCCSNRADSYDLRIERLSKCINELPWRSREVIRRRYTSGDSIRTIARDLRRTENAVGQLIFRIKKKLIACVASDKGEVGADAQ